jgi:4-hydroxybenzoate polyprenyltransferase
MAASADRRVRGEHARGTAVPVDFDLGGAPRRGREPLLRWLERRLRNLALLMRLDRPIGIWLLLWPTLWALWIAARGHPQRGLLGIFLAGTVLMRSAGCVVNDLADRNIDPHVKRTRTRPLAFRIVSPYEAMVLAALLGVAALALVLQLNRLTIQLALVGAALTVSYPLLKRFFPLPQLYLGLCFGIAVPMAFAATLGQVPRVGWLMLLVAVLWAGVYDTMYAMVDRDDDLRIGVQSSAILFGDMDRLIIAVMQVMILYTLVLIGRGMHFHAGYRDGLIAGACFFLWQQWLIRRRERDACLRAFLNNNYFGLAIFVAILLEYASR